MTQTKVLRIVLSCFSCAFLGEQSRLRRCGNQIRALSEGFFRPAMSHEDEIGPLRVWPCGLAVSRSIGDQDCGTAVIASPHIKQVEITYSTKGVYVLFLRFLFLSLVRD